VHLKRLPGLAYLWIRDTQITHGGAAELEAAFPKLKVFRDLRDQ